jgi:TonB family protein
MNANAVCSRSIRHFSAVRGVAFSLLCWAINSASAQDVSVSLVQWTNPNGAPDELPTLQVGGKLKFPEPLQTTPDVGYVEIEFLLDPKGKKLGSQRVASTPAFVRFYEEHFEQFKFSPARREGKGVNSSVTVALLFNPASAAVGTPDASPRLKEVGVVRLPWPKGRKPTDLIDDQIVAVDVTVDIEGRISEVKNAPAPYAKPIAAAAKNWRFAAARRGGEAVVADIRVPFVLVTSAAAMTGGKGVSPRVIFQQRPDYPFAMRASGMRGEVLVDFIVDIEGRVRNPYVIRSLNPAFDDSAIEAVRKWRFEPALVGARPVPTHMQVPIIFTLDGTFEGGRDGLEVTRKPDLSKLPEELRYDTPPKITGSARPVFPYALLKARKEGRATVSYIIDERGRVAQAGVREATAPEFGQALLAAIEQFVYQPAIKGGRPGKALLGFAQDFGRDESKQLVSSSDLDLLRREEKKPESILSLRDLDSPLVPLSRRPPKFPVSMQAKGRGEATIEFIVDEEGRARLPRIVTASDDAFGYAAVQAIADWRFEAPLRGGRAVPVRVQIPVAFAPAKEPAQSREP